jgi:hypothetical protein
MKQSPIAASGGLLPVSKQMRRKIDLLVLLAVLVTGFFAIRNAQAIGDWAHGFMYSPPAEIKQLATDAGMNDLGTKLFYRFSPQIVDRQTLDHVCAGEEIGCTVGRNIYILRSVDAAEANRSTVTAAHEMLHVSYSRMSQQEIDALKAPLDVELAKPEASKIDEALKSYPTTDYYNEAHSYIGSELSGISPTLESHYGKYFSDRTKTVSAYEHSPED